MFSFDEWRQNLSNMNWSFQANNAATIRLFPAPVLHRLQMAHPLRSMAVCTNTRNLREQNFENIVPEYPTSAHHLHNNRRQHQD